MSTQIPLNNQPDNINQQEANIDHLLQTGFETIVQAFELKSATLQATINEQNGKISELQNKIKLLKEEMNIIKEENLFYKKENEQLRQTNMKLNTSIKNKQMSFYNEDNSNDKETIEDNDNLILSNKQIPLTERREKPIKLNTLSGNLSSTYFRKSKNDFCAETKKLMNKINNAYLNNRSKTLYTNNNMQGNRSSSNLMINNKSLKNAIGNLNLEHTNNTKRLNTNVINNYSHIETRVGTLKKNIANRNGNFLTNANHVNTSINNNNITHINNNTNKRLDFGINNNNIKLTNNNRSHSLTHNTNNKNDYDQLYQQEDIMDITDNSTMNRQIDFIGQFLEQCKESLSPRIFDKVLNIFQEYKDGLLGDTELIEKIRETLQGHDDLIQMFESLFFD